MAAIMASTYKAYLGEGLGPLSFIKELRIPHPGRVRALTHVVAACCFAFPGLRPGRKHPAFTRAGRYLLREQSS